MCKKETAIVMPAYQAAKTLKKTVAAIPEGWQQHLVLCDDKSTDETLEVAKTLDVPHVLEHKTNRGYGANQKTLYDFVLEQKHIHYVVLLHPDFQYDPSLIPKMVKQLAENECDIVLGTRMQNARKEGMPSYKYWANRGLTRLQNFLFGQQLSEYHTGYRAFRKEVLHRLPYQSYSDNFIFDNQLLIAAICEGFRIGEVLCPARYFPEASSIGFWASCRYGLGVLRVSGQFWGRN